ncbi:mitochondrial carrier [Wolfiporia cocos MD-104 SS10]|uniref:Mitochondrial carrier n=1 Tax=Wolfiporia cocos (strain MD-104) TaxID=742152 RepID=A0A2H3ITM5_WOLCO|nr:mitochondrial carrier [Wolfiporia cocos MD-104 SS10]
MNTPPASLRDFYATPSATWSFVPPPLAASENSSTAVYAPAPAAAAAAYEWTTRTQPHPLLQLAAAWDDPGGGLDVSLVARGALAAALMRYATTALAMPWEVGRLLLQVQWVPRDAGAAPPGAVLATDPVADEDAELSDSSDNDAYFADPSKLERERDAPPRRADDRGYVVRQSVLEEGMTPEYVIPVGRADGTWGMMKQLGRLRAEGWLSLWKGLLTSTVTNALFAGVQPACHGVLQAVLPAPSPATAFLLPVASHVLTTVLLSPLDLVRTRLVVQSAHPRHARYSGPLDALRQILAEEGGLRGVYLHPHLLLPTLLDGTARALVALALPHVLGAHLGLLGGDGEAHPVAELLADCVGQLATLPIETVRRRLQVQVRGTAAPLRACVELRPRPYNGVVDALWHIITEERSDLPIKPRRAGKGKGRAGSEEREEGESWLRSTGIGQLYRGLGLKMSVSAMVFVFALFGGDDADAGWTEL